MENGTNVLHLKLMLHVIDCEYGDRKEKNHTISFIFSSYFSSELKERLQGFVLFIVKWKLINKYFSKHYWNTQIKGSKYGKCEAFLLIFHLFQAASGYMENSVVI